MCRPRPDPRERPRGARCCVTLRAVLWKNVLLKRRAYKTTFCEVFSPAIFLGMLVLAYFLSDTEYINAGIYAATTLEFGPLIEAVAPLVSGADGALQESAACLGGGGGAFGRRLQFGGGGGGGNSSCAGPNVNLLSLRSSLDALLNGPLPVLPIDIFLAVGLAAQSFIGEANYKLLTEFDAYLQLFGNILVPGTLHLCPDNADVRAFLNASYRRHPVLHNITVRVHPNESDAIHATLNPISPGERSWAVLNFNQLTNSHVDYAIRLNYSTVPNTNQISNWIARGLDTTYQRYITSGFFTLQHLVDEFVFERASREGVAVPYTPPTSYVVGTPMPTAAYSQNLFYVAVGFILSLILTMCQLFPVSLLTKAVVVEKELRLKQTMRIMGLRDSVLYSSWWISALVQFVLITILCTVVCMQFIKHTAAWIVFTFIGIFCLGAISFAFFLSVFFSNAVLSAVVGPVAFFGTLLPRYLFFSTNRYERVTSKIYASLLLPTAFSFGADILADYELSEIGISADNWAQDDYSFVTSLGMMLFDAILYSVLGLYLERVLPSKYGAREHPLFFLFPSWWACTVPPTSTAVATMPTSPSFEPPSKALRECASVEVVGLVKRYGSGRMGKLAVDNLHLSFFSGQISCLLGHNGAGKTTTLSVLTGLYPPTRGDCYVFGHSISKARGVVYRMLGICPQHDVLWLTLTVAEHLAIYATLKGVPSSERAAAVSAMMSDVGIPEKAHTRAHALSGGMKRKLSVGCALIGGSKAVLLDEPSSGMDPSSRRSMWELLRTAKPNRVLVLTTHYMDEADLLADRIAVMSAGKLKCCGSSLFLKARFGLGYTLTMVVDDGRASPSVTAAVTRTLQAHVAEAQLLSHAGDELAFRLPFYASPKFGKLLAHLDEVKGQLGVGSYGMSVTSMEEVFLRLAQGDDGPKGGGGASVPPPRDDADGGPCCYPPAGKPRVRPESETVLQTTNSSRPETRPASASSTVTRADVELSEVVEATPSEATAVASLAEPPLEPKTQAAGEKTNYVPLSWRPPRAQGASGAAAAVAPSDAGGEAAGAAAVGGEEREVRREAPGFMKMLTILFGKRWTCVKRDRRAVCTQQFLPIVLVALTMLILTVDDPRVGPSIRMYSGLYQRKQWNALRPDPPTEFVANEPRTHELLRSMNRSSLSWKEKLESHDSLNLSHYLLDSYNTHSREVRMGAASVDDTLHFNLGIGITPSAGETINELLGGLGIGDIGGVLGGGGGGGGAANNALAAAVLYCFSQRPNAAEELLNQALPGINASIPLPPLADLASGAIVALLANAANLTINTIANTGGGANGTNTTASQAQQAADLVRAALVPVLTTVLSGFLPGNDGATGIVDDALNQIPVLPDQQLSLGDTLQQLITAGVGQVDDLAASSPIDLGTVCSLVDPALDAAAGLNGGGDSSALNNGSFASASLLSGIGGLTINEQPAADLAIDVVLDALGRQLLYQFGTGFDNIQWAEALGPIADIIAPLRLVIDNPAFDVLVGLQETLVAGAIYTILTTQLGLTQAQAEALVPQGTIGVLIPPLREIVRLLDDLIALDTEPNAVARVTLLENTQFPLTQLIDALAAASNGQPAFQQQLQAYSAAGAPVTAGGFDLKDMSLTFGEFYFTQTGIVITNVRADATGHISLNGEPPAAPVPMVLTAAKVQINHEAAFLDQLGYVYGTESGTLEPIYFNATETPAPLDGVDQLNLTVPVPLTLLHNSSSGHALAAFVGEATASAWREMFALKTVADGNATHAEAAETCAKWSSSTAPSADVPSYAVHQAPLPLTRRQSLDVKLLLALLSSIFLLIPFCYIPAAAAVFVVRERISKSKHLQLVSGARAFDYWVATYLWDLCIYTLVIIGCMIVFALYGEPSFIGTFEQASAIFITFLLYGASVLPLVYCYSFMFDSPTTAQISIIIFNLVASFAMVLAHQIMALLPNTAAADAVLVWIYRLLPGYSFGDCVIKITTSYYQNELLGSTVSPFTWEVTGLGFMIMILEIFAYWWLLMRLERSQEAYAKLEPCLAFLCGVREPSLTISRPTRWGVGLSLVFALGVIAVGGGRGPILALLIIVAALGLGLWYERRLRRRGTTAEARAAANLAQREGGAAFVEEDDVAAERARVEGLGAEGAKGNAVWIQKLRKVYPGRGRAPPKVAVVDLSLGIPRAECFGFLGVNGAGKTTTLSILTGDYLPSQGQAWIDGGDVVAQRRLVRERMGYCPQADPLIELMTARETLIMFARLKNLPERSIPRVVRTLLDKVTLTPYADRVCGSYSGGNKRKLSLAIALVGSPAVVFLDEPSSGMDPVSRRHMWDIITRERSVRSIVLTTHSMEECEALCTRIGIMTAGRLQCLGGQQHLKSKYGGGYTLEMRVKEGCDKTVLAAVPELFRGATLEANHAGKLRYELPLGSLTLAAVFETMEARKDELGVLDYSCSQPSLESIFLTIAEKDINRASDRTRGGQRVVPTVSPTASAVATVVDVEASPRFDDEAGKAGPSAPGSSVLA